MVDEFHRSVLNQPSLLAKLESDYKALQVRNDEQVEIQSNEIQARQESLMNIAYAIDELKRRFS